MPNQTHKDEIDLREYVNVIIKRRKIILTIFFVSVITTAIVSFLVPKVYEVTTVIQLGNIDKLLISKDEAIATILNQNFLSSIIKQLNLSDMFVERLKKYIRTEDIKDTNLLKITIEYPGLATAFKINDALINPLIAQWQDIYQQRLAVIKARLEELITQIGNVEKEVDMTRSLIVNLPNTPGISPAEESLRMIILVNSLPTYETYLTSLKDRRNNLQLLLLSDAKEFKIVEKPFTPKHPIKPNKKLNVALSGIVSLMFGIFLVFFTEYWEKSKNQKANS